MTFLALVSSWIIQSNDAYFCHAILNVNISKSTYNNETFSNLHERREECCVMLLWDYPFSLRLRQ